MRLTSLLPIKAPASEPPHPIRTVGYGYVVWASPLARLLRRLTGHDGITLPRVAPWLPGNVPAVIRMADTIAPNDLALQILLEHELHGHGAQLADLGRVRYVWRYVTQGLRHGYRHHPMEADAEARRRALLAAEQAADRTPGGPRAG